MEGLNETNGLYITQPFYPPRQRFKIDVNGFDFYGNPLQRLISTIIQSSEESPPEIFVENESIEMNETESATITCHVKSLIPILMQLKWRDHILEEVNADQTTSLKLNLENVTRRDSGRYVCSALNRRGYSEGWINVTVRPRPLNVAISIHKFDLVENDTDIVIYCEISQKEADVAWSFSNGDLNNVEYEIIGFHLLLKKVKRNYAGIYTCTATSLYGGTANDTTNVTVSYAPEIIGDAFQFQAIQYNEQLNLHCPVLGVPVPQKLWYKKLNNETIGLPFTENVEIKEFKPHDEGIYVCKAQNKIGLSEEIKYHVTGRADVAPNIIRTISSMVEVKQGDNTKIDCKCYWCMPLTRYEWFYDEYEIMRNIRYDEQLTMGEIGNNAATLSLEIVNATESNAGQYTCRFENIYGYDELVIEVQVLLPPYIENFSIQNTIELNTREAVVTGSTCYIKCEASGRPPPKIQFRKDGVPIINNEQIITDNNTLILKETRLSDEGVYECEAINAVGTATKNCSLLVVAPPKLTTHANPREITVEGSQIALPCQVYALPPPKITWFFNNETLSTNVRKYVLENGTLSFKALFADSGTYKCVAENEIGTLVQELVLVVYVKPKILSENDETIRVESNSSVIMKCDATGFPKPSITWSFKGHTANDFVFIDELDDGKIQLTNVTLTSEGEYVCNAVNDAGSSKKKFKIAIYDSPVIISNFPSSLTVLPGERIQLTCDALGNPVPMIYWKYEDQEEEDGMLHEIKNVLVLNSSTIPKPASINYTCVAKNSVGTHRKSITLNLIDVPQRIDNSSLNQFTPTKDVIMFNDIELKCPFKSYDKLSWFKNNKPIGRTSHQQQENRLQLSMVIPKTSGNYTCIVENEAGAAEYTYKINVLSPPYILEIDGNLKNVISKNVSVNNVYEIMAALGEPVSFNCLADGNPQPDVSWKRNNVLLTNSSELTIKSAALQDSGVYLCEAINIVGKDSVQYKLEVFSEPIYEKGSLERFLQVNINDNIVLDCRITGNPLPTISWSKNGIPLRGMHNSMLEIVSADASTKGLYKCEGKNVFGVEEVMFEVNIFAKPSVTYTTPNTTIYSTDQLKLTCQAFGIPKPILTWHYNGRLLLTTSHIHYDNKINSATTLNKEIYINQYGNGININSFPLHNRTVKLTNINEMKRYYGIVTLASSTSPSNAINADEITFDLVLPSAAKKRSGKFSCFAANAIGRDGKHSFVKVLVVPTFKNVPTNQNVDVLLGMPIFLVCSTSGDPRPDIYWFKDLKELRMNDNTQLIEDGQMLTLLKSNIHDAGTYSCLAKNVAGENELTFYVRVMVPPSRQSLDNFIEDPFDDDTYTNIVVYERDSAELNCTVIGYPIPQITWTKLTYARKFVEEILPNNTTTLIVPNITDFSTYTCFANSSFGETKLVFHITVHKPPRLFNVDDKLVQVKMYDGFTLDCNVNGAMPEAHLTWLK
ncbi:Hemicentin-1, partial [Pseudolycoriella hygida]